MNKLDILKRIRALSRSKAEHEILQNLKGLLILSIPRSASTTLEQTCYKSLLSLGMTRHGEILSKHHYPSLEFYQYPKSHYCILRERCELFKYNIIRDVSQHQFVVDNVDWLKSNFNLLLLVRPIDDVYKCIQRRGWPQAKQWLTKRQNMLTELENDDSFQRLAYHDFIYKPQVLMSILREWYPKFIENNYITPSFIAKRRNSIWL